MKKLIPVILVLVMLFAMISCDDSEELGVTITNNLGVDLIDVKVGISDGSINGIILAEKLADGESAVLSLMEVCNDSEGFVNIAAYDDDAGVYKYTDVKLYDGVEVTLKGSKDSNVYLEYPYNNSTAQYSGEYVPSEPFEDPDEPAETDEPVKTEKPADEPDDDGIADEYLGLWSVDDEYLRVFEDGTFELLDYDGEVYFTGTCEDDDGLVLILEDGETALFVFDEDGNLYGGEDVGTLYRVEKIQADEADYEGYWMYPDGTVLEIYNDEWCLYDDEGNSFSCGPVEYDDEAAYLMNENGSSGGGKVYFDADGDLRDGTYIFTYYEYFPYGDVDDYSFNYLLEGEWYYSDQGEILYFDGVDSFTWTADDDSCEGEYKFDGEYLTFIVDGEVLAEATLNDDYCICVDGDAGSYYYQSERFGDFVD